MTSSSDGFWPSLGFNLPLLQIMSSSFGYSRSFLAKADFWSGSPGGAAGFLTPSPLSLKASLALAASFSSFAYSLIKPPASADARPLAAATCWVATTSIAPSAGSKNFWFIWKIDKNAILVSFGSLSFATPHSSSAIYSVILVWKKSSLV